MATENESALALCNKTFYACNLLFHVAGLLKTQAIQGYYTSKLIEKGYANNEVTYTNRYIFMNKYIKTYVCVCVNIYKLSVV